MQHGSLPIKVCITALWYMYTMECYSAIKSNAVESVLMRSMNLEPVIQTEVNQKEKDRYHILTHIYEIQKDGTDEPICGATVETDIENRLCRCNEERRGWDELRN